MRLFEAELHIAVISGMVLGDREQPLLGQGVGLQVTSKLVLAAAHPKNLLSEHKLLDVPPEVPP